MLLFIFPIFSFFYLLTLIFESQLKREIMSIRLKDTIFNNADSASKLSASRKITLSGSVQGTGNFNGSSDLTITTETNHTHNYAALSHTHDYAGSTESGGPATKIVCTAGEGDIFRPIVVTNEAAQIYYNSKVLANYSTGKIKSTGLIITDTTSAQHIKFSRAGWNYITIPTGGTLSVSINGNDGTTSRLTVDDSSVFPGYTTGKVSLGTASYKFSTVYASSFTGNSATATALLNPRTINGTSFDGSSNITTTNWGTSRTITIGATGKSVNGSGNISWTLSEIGAAATDHSHSYIPLSGGNITGSIIMNGQYDTTPFIRNFSLTSSSGWARSLASIQVDGKTKFSIGAYGSYTAGSSSNGITYAYIGCGTSYNSLYNLRFTSSDIKWGDSLLLHEGNWSTWCAAKSHAHDYLPTSGGTIEGLLTIKRSPSVIAFQNSSGTLLGYLGFSGSDTPTMYTASSVNYALLHSNNWSTWCAAKSHSHNRIVTEKDDKGNDYRSIATKPSDYSNNLIFKGIKSNSTINSPSSDTYSYLLGLRGWSDSSGGYSHEIAFNNSGIYVRRGASTSWDYGWDKVITSGNISSYAAAPNHSHTDYVTISGAQSITGKKTFSGGIAITSASENTSMPYFLGIDAFASGGTVKYISSNYIRSLIGAAASEHTHSYLPLSGGTISSSSYGPLIIERSGSTNMAAVVFKNSSGTLGSIGMNTVNGNLIIYNAAATANRTILDSSNYSTWAATKDHNHDDRYYNAGTSRTANTVLAAPNGSAGAASFRKLVAADIPALSISKITDLQTTLNGKSNTGHTHNYAGSSSAGGSATTALSVITGSMTGSNHSAAIKSYFESNKSTVPRNKLTAFYSGAYSNGSLYMGYYLSGNDSSPYGGFFVAHYGTPYYVGISYGSFTESTIITSGNYTSYTYSSSISRTANTVLAAPNGSNGVASFRKLVSADLPSHNHSAANITSGTLAVARGGTGQTTLNAAMVSLIESLTTATATPSDDNYYIAQDTGGASSYHRRKHSAMYNYIKGKLDSVYSASGHTHSNYVLDTGDTMTGTLAINTSTMITTKYSSTAYNILVNHNNGNISLSSASGGLYLGYTNTSAIYCRGTYVNIDSGNYTTYFTGYYSSTTSRTANTVLAAPNGSAGVASFRKLVSADLPSHNHSADNITSGTLAVARGGTGKTTLQDACNALINALSTGSSAPVDADYFVSQYAGGGTTYTTFHRRPVSALYSYMKGKMDSVYAAKSHTHSYASATTRNICINASKWTVYSSTTTDTTAIYAPTSVGSSGQILVSSGATSGPTWGNIVTAVTSSETYPLVGYHSSNKNMAYSTNNKVTVNPYLGEIRASCMTINCSSSITSYAFYVSHSNGSIYAGTTGNYTAAYFSNPSASGYSQATVYASCKNSSAYGLCTNGIVRCAKTESSSDRRLKEDIQNLSDQNDLIKLMDNIDFVSFNFKDDENKSKQYGFIAQDIQQYYPELVSGTEEEEYLSLDYNSCLILKIANLERKIKILEEKLSEFINE